MEAVQKYGAMIKSTNGYPSQSPYLAVVNRQADTMMRIASEFGFTPASRSRIFSYSQKNSMLLEMVDKPDDGKFAELEYRYVTDDEKLRHASESIFAPPVSGAVPWIAICTSFHDQTCRAKNSNSRGKMPHLSALPR